MTDMLFYVTLIDFLLLMHQYISIILVVLTGLMEVFFDILCSSVVHWFQFKAQAPLRMISG